MISCKPIKTYIFQQKYLIGFRLYDTWITHGGGYENCCILKCGVMQFERSTLRMKLLPPASEKRSYEGTSFLQNVGNYLVGYTAPHHKEWNYSTLAGISSSFPSHHDNRQDNRNNSWREYWDLRSFVISNHNQYTFKNMFIKRPQFWSQAWPLTRP